MNCPQCGSILVEPRESEKYCEDCGYPDDNTALFTLVEIKAYLRSMFAKVNCADHVRIENYMLACAYNVLTDPDSGIAAFCQNGKADGLTLNDFSHVRM